MKQVYWLDPIDKPALLAALMRELAGEAEIALEGEASELAAFNFGAVSGVREGVALPFREEWRGKTGKMLIMPLNASTVGPILKELLRKVRALQRVGAIQIQCGGKVEFLAGDNFHRECVSVGPGVTVELLKMLVGERVIAAYRTHDEARKWLRTRGSAV
jgi:hypothetical protein